MPYDTGKYAVLLGGVYEAERIPGTASDPTQLPTDRSFDLDPVFLSIGVNGTVNELRCIGNDHVEDFDSEISVGQWIQIQNGYGSSSGSGPNVIFDGIIVNKHYVIDGDAEHCEIVAFDHGSYLLRRLALHGQLRRGHTAEQHYFTYGRTPDSEVQLHIPGDVVLIDTPLCFNPDGQPNMTQDRFVRWDELDEANPPSFPLFEVPFRDQVTNDGTALKASYWTLCDAVEYLLNITNANWCIDPATYTSDKINSAFPDNPLVSNINCEGHSLAQALTELLAPHNYGWWVDPALNSNNLHDIHFFQKGSGRSMQLLLSARGTSARSNQSNLVQADLLVDNAATVNYLEAYGDRILYTTLATTNPSGSGSGSLPQQPTLVPAWNGSDLVMPPLDGYVEGVGGTGQPNWFDTTFRKNYCNPQLLTPPQGSETQAVFGVGRMWIVNLGEDPNDPLENLSNDLCLGSGSGSTSFSSSGSNAYLINNSVTGNNSIDPRRFERPELYTTNTAGGLLSGEEVVVEMSTNSGNTWQIVERSEYRLLPDSLGIVFTNPDLTWLGYEIPAFDGSSGGSGSGSESGKGYWQALYDGTLEIRVLASIKSDERVHCTIENDGSAFPLAIGAVFNNTGYKRVIYNSAINDSVYFVNYPPSEIDQDDTAALTTLAQQSLENTNRTTISGAARVLFDSYGHYLPGDSITSISHRAITMASNPTVIHIVYKFQEQQVELTLDNHRVSTLVKAKAINQAANERQHKLGVENPIPLQGGHGGPYIPETNSKGTNPSLDKYWEMGGGF